MQFTNFLIDPSLVTDYFSQEGVSSSTIGSINPQEGGTPKRYQGFLRNQLEKKSTGFSLGTALHQFVEHPEMFMVSESSKPDPTTKSGKYADAYLDFHINPIYQIQRNQAGVALAEIAHRHARKKAEYADRYNDDTIKTEFKKSNEAYVKEKLANQDKTFLTSHEKEQLEGMKKSISEHPTAGKILFSKEPNVFREFPIIVNCTVPVMLTESMHDMVIKGKIDQFVIDYDNKVITIYDLKTTSENILNFRKSVVVYKYYRQAAFYRELIRSIIPADLLLDWKIEFKNIVVETHGLYECKIFNMSNEYLQKGLTEIKELLSRIAFHEVHDQWDFTVEELANDNYELELVPSNFSF